MNKLFVLKTYDNQILLLPLQYRKELINNQLKFKNYEDKFFPTIKNRSYENCS